MPARFIVTTTPELQKNALRDLCAVAPDIRKTRNFKNGIFLAETDLPIRDVLCSLADADPIFINHIMPVDTELTLAKSRDIDLPAILSCTQSVCSLAASERFAVQCRRVGTGYDYDAKDVEVFVGSHYEVEGAVPQFSDVKVSADSGLRVISIYLFKDTGFIGFSTVAENLNEHCDEYHVFSRHPRSVSRAEFKLMEALRKFRIDIPAGRALDLGAAPGGWTKVLADAGMQVVAVDPAELDAKVTALPNMTHAKLRAESYVSDGDFDLLVNDMNIEPEASAQLMVQMARHLKPSAYAIMTVKLVIRNPACLLANVTPILLPAYDILRTKNLFHNRLEVTMLLRRKG